MRRRVLNGPATTALVLGLCLFTGQGYPGVLARVWPPLGAFNPAMWASPTITSSALSQARTRLPVAVLPKLFAVLAKAVLVEVAGRRVVGLVVTAADGTVMDLADTAEIRERCATPSGSRFPQARIVTLVACGTRRVLGIVDSFALSEQALRDRMVAQMTPGTLNLADRNFFSVHSRSTAAGTGANLMWRVKNGAKSLPAKVVSTHGRTARTWSARTSPTRCSVRGTTPRRAGRGRLHATPAGRTGLQDHQVHSAQVRPATARQALNWPNRRSGHRLPAPSSTKPSPQPSTSTLT